MSTVRTGSELEKITPVPSKESQGFLSLARIEDEDQDG